MTEDQLQQKLWDMKREPLGDFGERLWSNVFKWSNLPYIPLCKIETGGAPLLEGQHKSRLLDFDVYGDGWTAFIDSKAKTASVMFWTRNQERHGFNRDCWDDYGRIAMLAGKPCAIAVLECFTCTSRDRWSGALLIQTLKNLGEPYRGTGDQSHMIYWRRDDFRLLNTYDATEIFAIHAGSKRVSFKFEMNQVFARKFVQQEMFSA